MHTAPYQRPNNCRDRLRGSLNVVLLFSSLFWLILPLTSAGIRAERLPVRIFTSADGLGSSAAFNLIRDSRGFIWLCSRDGLIRFDGYRFITYRIGADDADPAVFDLLPTRGGDYWINLNRGTDYRFAASEDDAPLEPINRPPLRNDTRISLKAEPVSERMLPIFEDSGGNLWSADGKSLYVMSKSGGSGGEDNPYDYRPVELNLPGNPTGGLRQIAIREGRDRRSLWIGTHWGLVRRLPDGKQIHFSLQPSGDSGDPAFVFAEDNEERIWIARPDGLLVLKVEAIAELNELENFSARRPVIKKGPVSADGRAQLPQTSGEAFSFSFADILRRAGGRNAIGGAASAKPVIHAMIRASDGRIWIATNHGLVVFDGSQFRHFTSAQGLGSNPASFIAEDGSGLIWLASYSGLQRLNPNGLISYDAADGLVQSRMHSIYEDRNGDLSVVADNWNISRLENGGETGAAGGGFKTGRPALPNDAALSWHSNVALLDSRGDWWIVTRQKLYRYTDIERAEQLSVRAPTNIYGVESGFAGDNIYRVFEDSNGDVWVSVYPNEKSSGLSRWERAAGKFRRFELPAELPQKAAVSAFAEDKAGNLWLGLGEEGIVRYSGKDKRFAFFAAGAGYSRGLITSIFADNSGRLWVSSSIGGLTRIDDPTAEQPSFRRYTIADGLTSNNVRCITEDLFGNIYVGTVRGVNRLTPETGQIKYYGTGDGLASDFVSAAYRDRHGAIWFGTYSGLSKLVPKPDTPSPPPPILISGLRIAGVDYSVSPLGQREAFAPAQEASKNNVQIDFFSINTRGSDSIRYQYKLEGTDSDWSAPGAERSVTFANLSPGAYRFLVRAVNAEGVASEQPAAVSFTILRPVWQRWWFLVLAALAISFLIYAVYRYRLRRLLELERVRTRIATDLHDDIGASLSKIAILSEVVHQRISPLVPGNSEIHEPLEHIAGTSREMVDSMSDIVWAINPARDHLSDLLQRMRNLAGEMTELAGMGLRVKLSGVENLLETHLGADLRREVFLIFKETVNNLVKHSECETVEIEFRCENNDLIITVKDDGKGFEPAATTRHNGAHGNGANRGGNGLINMRRRAESLGGKYEIESAVGCGATARLRVPLKSGFHLATNWKNFYRKK